MGKRKIALNPKHPERICWGCDKYCSVNDLRCGNGTIRTPHPVELFGEDWLEWEHNNQTPLATENTQPGDAPKQKLIDTSISYATRTKLPGVGLGYPLRS